MSFAEEYMAWENRPFEEWQKEVTQQDVLRVLAKDGLGPEDFIVLLAPAAEGCLEAMAQKAHRMTVQHFGRTMMLYTPLYLSNYCENYCLYCGFSSRNHMGRRQLTVEEAVAEGQEIAKTGLRHLLLVTGDAPKKASVDYLVRCLTRLRESFSSLALEIYALTEDEYRRTALAGADGLTIYQETYDRELYDRVHARGAKKDFAFRLDAPERACRAGIRQINVGALLGLGDWRRDGFYAGLHAAYLQKAYGESEISISLPRMRPSLSGYQPSTQVTDRNLVQFMLAFRLFQPRAGITVSTREAAEFRDRIIPLGVTKMSAGSCTVVGGRQGDEGEGQFDIADHRSVAEMMTALQGAGYQPVLKDWEAVS